MFERRVDGPSTEGWLVERSDEADTRRSDAFQRRLEITTRSKLLECQQHPFVLFAALSTTGSATFPAASATGSTTFPVLWTERQKQGAHYGRERDSKKILGRRLLSTRGERAAAAGIALTLRIS